MQTRSAILRLGSEGVQLQIVPPARYQWIQIGQANQIYYVNTSRCKDTENYPPRGGTWLVEAGKAVETAVGITVASDDDTSVKGAEWKYLHQIFPSCLSIYIFLIPSLIFPAQFILARARIAIGEISCWLF